MAANAAAKDIYEQTAQGKMAGDAVLSGLGTAGAEVLKSKIDVGEMLDAIKIAGKPIAVEFLSGVFSEVTEGIVDCFIDFLADKAGRDSKAEFSLEEFLQSVIAGAVPEPDGKNAKMISEALGVFWDTLGG